MSFMNMFGIGARDDTGAAFASVNANLNKTANNAKKLNGNLRIMRGGMGQLGHQIQDVAVQLQMGQNALMVFTQQGSQVASLFGPTGAIIGAVGAVAGALAAGFLPSLMDSTDHLEELQKEVDDLAKLMRTDASSGITVYSGKLEQLAKVSEAAAEHLKLVALLEAEKRLRELDEQMDKTIDSFDEIELRGARGMMATVSAARRLGLSASDFKRVEDAMMGLGTAAGMTHENFGFLLLDIMRSEKASKEGINPEFQSLVATFFDTHSEMLRLNDQVDRFNEAGLDEGADKAATQFERFLDRLTKTTQKAEGLTPAQMAGIELQNMEGLSKAEQDLAADLIRRLRQTELNAEAAKRKAEADREAAKAARDQAKADRDAAREAESLRKQREDDLVDAAGRELRQRQDNTKRLESLRVSFLDEIALLGEQETQKRDFLNSLGDEFFNDEFTRQDALTQLEQQFADKRTKIYQDEQQQKREIQLAGMQVVKDSLSFMAANLKEGTALQKTAFLATKAFAASEAIVSAELAAAKMLARDVGIFGLGAIASANIVRGFGYASAANIMAQAVASFDGGGFTGRGARSGGLDGRGGFMAMLHPNETVVDHTKGGSGVTIVNNIDATGGGPDVDIKIRRAVEMGNQQTVHVIRDLAARGRLV